MNPYYGASDWSMALATGNMRPLLSWLDSNSAAAEGMNRVCDRGRGERVC
jgi:hypothetical protein